MGYECKNKIFAGLLLILLVGYMSSVMCFTHVHLVDGVYVTHSHPFDKKSPHNHPKSETIFFYSLSHYLTTPLEPVHFFEFRNTYCVTIEIPFTTLRLQGEKIVHHLLRAPPFILC